MKTRIARAFRTREGGGGGLVTRSTAIYSLSPSHPLSHPLVFLYRYCYPHCHHRPFIISHSRRTPANPTSTPQGSNLFPNWIVAWFARLLVGVLPLFPLAFSLGLCRHCACPSSLDAAAAAAAAAAATAASSHALVLLSLSLSLSLSSTSTLLHCPFPSLLALSALRQFGWAASAPLRQTLPATY